MITVAEAIEMAAQRAEAVAEPVKIELSDDDQMRYDYIDATLEAGICKGFRGEIFDFRLPALYEGNPCASPEIVAALIRRYEEGGWQVVARPQFAGDEVVEWQLIFAPTSKVVLPERIVKTVSLPPVARIESSAVIAGKRLLVRMPTRGRANQAVEVLTKYREMAGVPILMEVVVDEDDEDTLRAEVLQRFAALNCVVTVGQHDNKIEACNSGRIREWDILVLASDDMWPVEEGWAVRVLEAMEQHWPHLDGALHFNDGHQRSNLCTLPVMGRRLWNRWGYVYHPAYKSLYCDREQTELLKSMGRLVYVDEKIIEHRHHAWGRAPVDALYERNDAMGEDDRNTYEKRRHSKMDKEAQWGFNEPVLWFSILICTVPARRAQLERLLDNLYTQIDRVEGVDILIDDREGVTVGEKRQTLLKKSQAHYVAYVDDDDEVAHDYVQRIVDAVAFSNADCASLEGIITTDGRNPQRFSHSISNGPVWRTEKGVHLRGPNHLSVVKRNLALQAGFESKNIGEDHGYASRLFPLLKKEVSTGNKPLYFYFWNSKQTVQSK